MRSPDAASEFVPYVRQRGIVPCMTCGKLHDLIQVDRQSASWADPDDGHAYHRMTAEQVVKAVMRTLGAEIVDEHAADLRRLAK